MSGRRPRDERGQVTLMIIGFTAVLVLAIAVVVDASAAYLHRAGLDTLADGAALAAADALDEERTYAEGLGAQPDLDQAAGRVEIAAYLRSVDAFGRFPGLRVTSRVAGNEVVVQVSAPFALPLQVPGAQDRVQIGSSGSAELQTLG